MEVGESRNLHGDAGAGIATVYTVTKAGTTRTEIQSTISMNKNIIVTGLTAVGITGTSAGDPLVSLGSPSATTASKSSASSGTSSHVVILICALAAVMIPTTLL